MKELSTARTMLKAVAVAYCWSCHTSREAVMEIPQQLCMGSAPVSRRGRGPSGAKAAAALAAHAAAHGATPPLC